MGEPCYCPPEDHVPCCGECGEGTDCSAPVAGGFFSGSEPVQDQLDADHAHVFEPPWCEMCGPPCRRTDDDALCAVCRASVGRWHQ